MVVRLLQHHPLAGQGFQLISHLETGLPVALLLIDGQQVLECGTHMQLGVLEFPKQVLGTVEQTGAHVVLPQFQQRLGALFPGQGGTCNQVLVDADGALDLATAPKQIAERQMSLDSITVHLEHLDEGIDRLVRLFIQQMVETAEVHRARLPDTLAFFLARTPAGCQPTGSSRYGQQQEEEFLHRINVL